MIATTIHYNHHWDTTSFIVFFGRTKQALHPLTAKLFAQPHPACPFVHIAKFSLSPMSMLLGSSKLLYLHFFLHSPWHYYLFSIDFIIVRIESRDLMAKMPQANQLKLEVFTTCSNKGLILSYSFHSFFKISNKMDWI